MRRRPLGERGGPIRPKIPQNPYLCISSHSMKIPSKFLLFLSLILPGLCISDVESPDSISENASISNADIKALAPFQFPEEIGNGRGPRRTILSVPGKQDTTFVVEKDGTVSLEDNISGNILWSFSSGAPLCSSHHVRYDAPGLVMSHNDSLYPDYEFIDVEHDGSLYRNNTDGRQRLPYTIKEYVSRTPYYSNGEFTVGSKKSTIFLVDAKTGRVIHTYSPHDNQLVLGMQSDQDNLVLPIQELEGQMKLFCFSRTDYGLQSYRLNQNKVSREMSFSEIHTFPCEGFPNSWDKLGLEFQNVSKMPLPHETKALIPRDFSLFVHPPLGSMLTSTTKDDSLRHAVQVDPWTESCETCLVKTDGGFKADVPSRFKEDVPNFPKVIGWSLGPYLVLVFVLVLVLALVLYMLRRGQIQSDTQSSNFSGKQSIATKKKKPRRGINNKNGSILNKNGKRSSSEEEVESKGLPTLQKNDKRSFIIQKMNGEFCDGRWVGKLFVSNKEIAKGSNGTIVFEGVYDRHRKVAVKRLVLAHNDVAFKEIDNLILSDRHPNIVRWYGVEQDLDFVYLSLEHCTCSLNDLIQVHSETFVDTFTNNAALKSVNQYEVQLESVMGITKEFELWSANGHPSPLLLKLMRDVVSGLVHLHELGIIHRDLKPQNVLISTEGTLCAKLSDMGISKRLYGDMSSLGHHATGYGSSGWQAPEQLQHGRQTRAVDLFSLGCVLFFCITGGRHPFGDRLERDMNIVRNSFDLFLVEHIPEAVDLFTHLLDPNPDLRPKAKEVLHHPMFWNSETRLSFLRDASDRVESENRECDSDLLKALEKVAPVALGGNWDEKLEAKFIENIGRYRRYSYDSTRDLLRVIRNKLNHYRDLPTEIQELLGPVPVGFGGYFASRFPKLLIEVYKVIYKSCRQEECFQKYFESDLI